jgi:hypothetical protein
MLAPGCCPCGFCSSGVMVAWAATPPTAEGNILRSTDAAGVRCQEYDGKRTQPKDPKASSRCTKRGAWSSPARHNVHVRRCRIIEGVMRVPHNRTMVVTCHSLASKLVTAVIHTTSKAKDGDCTCTLCVTGTEHYLRLRSLIARFT